MAKGQPGTTAYLSMATADEQHLLDWLNAELEAHKRRQRVLTAKRTLLIRRLGKRAEVRRAGAAVIARREAEQHG